MKKMLLALALLPSLGFSWVSQDASWKDLAPGDPIEVTLLNGATIRGRIVVPRTKTPPVDFAAESAVMLDVSLEAPGVAGTMTFAKQDLRGFRRLRIKMEPNPFPTPEKQPQPAPKAQTPSPAATDPVVPKPDSVLPSQEDKDKEKEKEAEELKKAIDFYNKFLPPDWGPIRHTLDLQKQARGQALNPAEREFEAGYPDLWEKGRDASQKK